MARTVSTHWLRENARTATPYRVLVFDTETRPRSDAEPNVQVLRLWSAQLIRRHGIDPKLARTQWFDGTSAAELAATVDRLGRQDRTLWTFAHNLSFDLAVTALPVELSGLGWALTEGALTSDSPWCRMARRGARLTLADSWSWLPLGLKELGPLLGMAKLALPSNEDSDAAWLGRCRRDVEITATGILQVMDWWDAGQLGNWSVTGPASGWSTYRHRKPAPRVLVNPDSSVRNFEARAISGGRREARRTGELPRGLYADLDLATAHLAVMASRPLPARRFQAFDHLDLASPYLRSGIFDVLAEVELDVETPRYPWDSGRGVFFPTGQFRTVLAGPEIREAAARDELRSIGAGHVYYVRNHMAGWALWLASLIAQETPDVPPAVRLTAKHWSRCVPGKWAGHTSEVIRKTPDPRPGWAVERGAIDGGRRAADFLRLGGELWTIARDEWADDAFPAILAFIQSYTRLALGRLLDFLEPAVVSCNTDGVLVDVLRWARSRPQWAAGRLPAGAVLLGELDDWCQAIEGAIGPFAVRIKGAWSEATVLGPQHLILNGERRLAGIPHRAVQLADGRYQFTAWPKLRVQLIPDGPPAFRTEDRTIRLDRIPPTGWLLADRRVLPIRLDPGAAPGGIALPAASAPGSGQPDELAPAADQHPLLRPVAQRAYGPLSTAQDAPGRPANLNLAPVATPAIAEAPRAETDRPARRPAIQAIAR